MSGFIKFQPLLHCAVDRLLPIRAVTGNVFILCNVHSMHHVCVVMVMLFEFMSYTYYLIVSLVMMLFTCVYIHINNRITFLYFSVAAVLISFVVLCCVVVLYRRVAQLWKARTRFWLTLMLSLSAIITACFIIAVPVLVTSISAYQALSSEVIFKLATFKGADYSSFSVTSDIPQGTTTSATVWITHSVEPTSSIYSGSLTLQDKTLQLFALPGSNFEDSFSALSGIGIADENVTVKFTGSKHTDDKSYTIRVSTTGHLMNYTASDSGFIQVRVINNGLQGNFSYQFTVKELNSSTLHQSWYRCIMNSINNVCRHASAEGINCLLVHVTLDNDNRGYPNFDVNLIGREKHVLPLHIALPTTFLVIILCLMVLFVYCVYIICICIQILKQY